MLQGGTALTEACRGDEPEAVKLLLSKGADVSAVDAKVTSGESSLLSRLLSLWRTKVSE